MQPLLSADVLNGMRRQLYGDSASLVFYKVTPLVGEEEIATLSTDWYAQAVRGGAAGAIKIIIALTAKIEITDLLENAAMDFVLGSQVKRYRVVGLTETQQLGAGWVIHAEPMSSTI